MLSQLSYTPIAGTRLSSYAFLCEVTVFGTFKIEQLLNTHFPLILTRVCSAASNEAVSAFLHRKEVIQPHLPIRLPCYDFTPVINPTFDDVLLAVRLSASGVTDSHGVTGGVYKARERIHRGMLIRDY